MWALISPALTRHCTMTRARTASAGAIRRTKPKSERPRTIANTPAMIAKRSADDSCAKNRTAAATMHDASALRDGRTARRSSDGTARRRTAKPVRFATSPHRNIHPHATGPIKSASHRDLWRRTRRRAAAGVATKTDAATTSLHAQSVGTTKLSAYASHGKSWFA